MINFVISQLDSIPSLDGMDKVISVIHWRAQKTHSETIYDWSTETRSEKDLFTAYQYGAMSLSPAHPSNFIPYSEVTQDMVINWLEASLDTEAIEANLDAQIENFLNPPLIAYKLPWQSNNIS